MIDLSGGDEILQLSILFHPTQRLVGFKIARSALVSVEQF